MSKEIEFINQIEKHEFLYNFNLPEYNRKDLVEEAWANVAASTNMSISDCKEKWRNIRSSFLRSMKPCGFRVKKPYYLTDYLKFLLPFLKPNTRNMNDTDDSQYEDPENTNESEIVTFIKVEPMDGDVEENNENQATNGILSDILTRRSCVTRKRRRFIPERKNYTDPHKTINRTSATSTLQRTLGCPSDNSEATTNVNNEAMKMFLMSLLPEIETMTEDQIRLFKIKSMMLIDEIKVNYTEVRQSTLSINNERLQKRLINLLMKNLQRATKDNAQMKQ